ncbi:hypothetical protein BP6252_09544 [Coleophoma cylindrospora]|uniref:alpha-galactosidase n=1 Tax=Coleophoma cylindrospora TaxID=1849047 RepID=A0A3D8R2H6_9HELO|nr:hypothetical protein BP6252_09544 [Coleophoma cylindrospora]
MRLSSGYKFAGPESPGGLSGLWNAHKKIFLICGSIIAILVIALAVALGVGLRNSSHTASVTPNLNYSVANATQFSGWNPEAGTTWQIVLLSALNDTSADVDVYDIDLFTNSASTISTLQGLGRKVICYFSAGSYEDFRPDSSDFQKTDYGKGLDGWQGEWWLNTNSSNVRSIMIKRLDLAVTKGCDGVDPDNIDGYDNDTGLDLTEDTAIEYLTFLASEAHSRNLAIGLKNGGNIVNQTLDMMQWQINEQCEEYNECGLYTPFIAANKPVFHIEYPSSAPAVSASTKSSICDNPAIAGFSTVIKKMNLDAWIETC